MFGNPTATQPRLAFLMTVALIGCADVAVDTPEPAQSELGAMLRPPRPVAPSDLSMAQREGSVDYPNKVTDASASYESLELGTWSAGALTTIDDVDVFTLPVVLGKTYTIMVVPFEENGERPNTILYVTDPNATIVVKEFGHGYEPGESLATFRSGSTGTAYVAVGSYQARTSGYYSVLVTEQKLFNSNFELGSRSWVGPFGTDAEVTEPGYGNDSLRLKGPHFFGSSPTRVSQTVRNVEGDDRFVFFFAALGSSSGRGRLAWLTSDGTVVREDSVFIPRCYTEEGWEGWKACQIERSRPSAATKVRVTFENNGSGDLLIDNAWLEPL